MSFNFKKLIEELVTNTELRYIRRYFTKKYLKELYAQYKTNMLLNENNLVIKSNGKNFGKLITNDEIFFNSRTFSKTISNVLIDFFESFKKQELNESSKVYIKNQSLHDNTAIDGIIEKVKAEVDDETKETVVIKTGELIPSINLKIDSLHAINNKISNFKFLLNNNIKLKNNLDTSKVNTVSKIKFEITKQLTNSAVNAKKLITKYEIICPVCHGVIEKLPYEINQKIKHGCAGLETKNGSQGYTEIKTNAIKMSNFLQLYLYEAKINDESGAIGLYSFDNNLMLGKYVADVFVCSGAFEDKNEMLLLMLGYERQKPKVINNLVNITSAVKWCEKKKFPMAKFLVTLFSIRNLHKVYSKYNINDKGFLLQLFITLSGLAKQLFNYRILGINVVGNKSLGKTFSGVLFAMALDKNYKFIQHSSDCSVPGLKGGINNNYVLNGIKMSILQEGVFTTGGLTVFDEAALFFDRKNTMLNESLKSLPDKVITIQKIGGGERIPQNYTPILFSNFTEFSVEFTSCIENDYFLLNIRQDEKERCSYHKKNKADVIQYLRKINLYLPLDYYVVTENNVLLAKVISAVRDKYTRRDVDWKTGGSLASDSRFLFSIVVKNYSEKLKKNEKIKAEDTQLILPSLSDIPYLEFIESIKNYYNINNINLGDIAKNSDEVNNQLDELSKDIALFLSTDGLEVFLHLSNNTNNIDSKTNSILFACIKIMQLLEDSSSVKLSSNIKTWCKLIFLKCKRGITEKEYNFVDNNSFGFHNFDDIKTEVDIETSKNQNASDLLVNSILKQKEAENKKLDNIFDEVVK